MITYTIEKRDTMKLIAIVGTNAKLSFNRKLLTYMKHHFSDKAEIELCEVSNLPIFCEDAPEVPEAITQIAKQIDDADGVIIGAPEYNHAVPAALKSLLEWLSWSVHPFTKKPIIVVGVSLGNMGTVNSQSNLKHILNSPGINAYVLPGNQFLLGHAHDAFDAQENLRDAKTASWLDQCFGNFVEYINAINFSAARNDDESVDVSTGSTQIDPNIFKAMRDHTTIEDEEKTDTDTGASNPDENLHD